MHISTLPDRPFTSSDASSFGLSRAALRSAVRDGVVRRVVRGVYLRSDLALTLERKLAAVALVINPDLVACDRTAAWLWGVDAYAFRELDVVPPVETFALRGRRRSERPETRGGERDLAPGDWVVVAGVKVTTPLRTALDLGCLLPRRDALAAMDALVRGHGLTRSELARSLPRYFRRRGVVQLRGLVPLVDARAESPRESWLRLEILDHGLPAPELQWWVEVDGVPTYRLDLAYPHAKIAIEYDGAEFHTSPADRARDEARRAWLRAHGWTVIVVTAADFAPDADCAWLSAIAEALSLAQRPTRRSYPRQVRR